VVVEGRADLGEEGDEVGCFGGGLRVLPVDVEAVEAEAGELQPRVRIGTGWGVRVGEGERTSSTADEANVFRPSGVDAGCLKLLL
jgi:hypothetical protein